MRRHRGGYFWGVLFIIIGGLLILENLGYKIDFWRYFWPFFLIYIGFITIFRPSRRQKNTDGNVIFDEGMAKASDKKKEYSAVFGHGIFDFTELNSSGQRYEVSAVFGKSEVKIQKNTPVRISGSAAFGEIVFPDGKTAAFGERVYEKNIDSNKNILELKASAVFGAVVIIEV